jgi:hypothetical protein
MRDRKIAKIVPTRRVIQKMVNEGRAAEVVGHVGIIRRINISMDNVQIMTQFFNQTDMQRATRKLTVQITTNNQVVVTDSINYLTDTGNCLDETWVTGVNAVVVAWHIRAY